MSKKAVKSRSLNFRKSPDGKIIQSLRMGKKVELLDDPDYAGWVKVNVKADSERKNGYVHGAFLRKLASPAKEKLVNVAIKEWIRFDRGSGKEHRSPYFRYVGQMWKSLNDPRYSGVDGRDREIYWSAACISYFVRKSAEDYAAYNKFKYAAAHARYIHQAIQRAIMQEDGPFWGYRRTAKKPKIGDIVCQWRETRRTYSYARDHSHYSSHTDLIVAVNDDDVITIGGNVGQSVKMKTFRLNSNGHLRNEKKVIALMKNRL